ncbi:MAG: hypothetical protein K6E33_06200 [Lachnospiraceae bacterium]|nr:hypothetical protein [Lachnospiraceae bacterium]
MMSQAVLPAMASEAVPSGDTEETSASVSAAPEESAPADDFIYPEGSGITQDSSSAEISGIAENASSAEISGIAENASYSEDSGITEDASSAEADRDTSSTLSSDNLEETGYVYEIKDEYDLIFKGYNNGQVKTLKYKIPADTATITVPDYLKSLYVYDSVLPDMDGFLDTGDDKDSIAFWDVTKDGVRPTDFFSLDTYNIEGGHDYTFTVSIIKKLAENIYVHITPKVYYDGRSHVSYAESDSTSKISDIYLFVVFREDAVSGASYRVLTQNTDYKVAYKNNKEPSMSMQEDGSYSSLYSEDKNRPQVIITGKGNYAGFTVNAYFDILPRNFSTSYPYANLTGLKKTYALKNGKLSQKINPKASLGFIYVINKKYVKKTVSLKEDTDYNVNLYRYNQSYGTWVKQENNDPNAITQSGDYLYTLWGTGRYCGVAFDGTENGEFSDGSKASIYPPHYSYTGSSEPANAAFQFRVSEDIYQDLTNAKISIGKPAINFDGNNHTADDFKLKVTIGSGSDRRSLTEGTDFYIVYDGVDFPYISGRTYVSEASDYLYDISTCDAVYTSKIGVANTYKVTVNAIAGSGYYGSLSGKTVKIKGVDMTTKGFEKVEPLVFDGTNHSISIRTSSSGQKDGLTYLSPAALDYDTDNKCTYLSTITSNPGFYGNNYYTFLSSYYNAAPGTYYTTLIPVGGGVTHGSPVKIPFERKKISLKDAVKKSYISLSIGAGTYNAGGVAPGEVTVTFLGADNSGQTVKYNGDKLATPYTNYMTTSFNVKMTKNNKAGDGALLTLSGSDYFTGSYTFKYSIKAKTLSQASVPVLYSNPWYKNEGKTVKNALPSSRYTDGQIVATVSDPVKYNGKALRPKIKLYQVYYKDAADEKKGKLSMASLNSKQFKITTTDISGTNCCSMDAVFSAQPLISGFNTCDIPLQSAYGEYDAAAKIESATVVYQGSTYTFDAKADVSFPFEGRQIRFDRGEYSEDGVISVTLKDGTVLDSENFRVEYGDNIVAKKKGGTFKIILKQNSSTNLFPYGGTAQFKFTITPKDPIDI